MRILTRYILREVISHAAIGVAVFTFVLFTRDLGHILDLVVRNSAPLPSVLEIFLYTLPVAFTYTIPMGVLVGILIGLSRLAADSEITAMRASGIGVWTFLRVVSIFAVTAWALAMFNAVYLAPASQAALGRLEDRLKTSQGAAIWRGVFIADISNPASPRITLARQGILVSEGPQMLHLHLTNGSTHATDPASADHYQISTFDQTDVPIPVPQTDSRDQEPVPAAQMGTWQLRDQARKVKKYVAPWYLIEFHRRFALPTSCLVLALVGIPLGLSAKKGGKSAGFVLTILLVFAYYSVTLIGVSLARQGKVPPALGAWLANIVFFLGGAFLLWRAERRPLEIGHLRARWNPLKTRLVQGTRSMFRFNRPEDAFQRAVSRRRVFSASFPT